MSRDFQKSKLYKWEREIVAPRSNIMIKFENAQMFVDGVWMSLGLIGAPIVELIDERNKRVYADASRTLVRLRPETPAWVIVHELAHTLNREKTRKSWQYDGIEACDGHGPNFVGHYIKLLDKVLGIPLALTMYSLKVHGVECE